MVFNREDFIIFLFKYPNSLVKAYFRCMHVRSSLLPIILLALFLMSQGNAYAQSWTLEKCIQTAWENNIQLQQSALNEKQVELSSKTAMGAMLPNLNAQGTHGYNWGQRIDPFTNSFASERIRSNSFGISSSIDLFTGGQNWANYQKCLLDKDAAHWNLENTKNQVALQTANAFLNVMLNVEIEKIAFNTKATSFENLNRLKKQMELGVINEGAVAEMEAQYMTDQANWVVAQNNFELSKLNLAQLLLLSPEQTKSFELVFPDVQLFEVNVPLPPKSLVLSTAMQDQASIKSAFSSLSAAHWSERSAKGAVLPRVSASMSYGTGYSGAAKILSGSGSVVSFPIGTVGTTNDWVYSIPQTIYSSDDYRVKPFQSQLNDNVNRSFFVSMTMPIFNGFQTHAQVQRAKINKDNADLNLQLAMQRLIVDVENAYANADAAQKSFQAQELSLTSNEKAYALAKAKFDNGVLNATEMTNARNRLDIARAQNIRARLDLIFKRNVIQFYMNQPIQLQP